MSPDQARLAHAPAQWGGDLHGRPPVVRPRRRARLSPVALQDLFRLSDAFAVMLCMILAFQLGTPLNIMRAPVGEVAAYLAGGFLMSWLLASSGIYAFVTRPGQSLAGSLAHVLSVALATATAGAAAALVMGLGAPVGPPILGAAAAALTICVLHLAYRGLEAAFRRSGALTQRVAVIGLSDTAVRLIERLNASGEAEVAGVFHDRENCDLSQFAGAPVVGDVMDLLAWPHLPEIDRVVVCLDPLERARLAAVLRRIIVLPHPVALVMETPRLGDAPPAIRMLAGTPLADLSGAALDERRALVKRVVDVILSAVLLVFVAPVMLTLAVGVRLTSPGPILFKQRRYGLNNSVFMIFKFRTMWAEACESDRMTRQRTADDDRVTPFGAFLRKTNLDELPQLLNVLLGDMALVGPRPHAVGMTVDGFDPFLKLSDYAYRHRVKPGLTGLAQVNGSRGPVADWNALEERLAFDLAYVQAQSLWMDLTILARTLPALFGEARKLR